MKTFATIKHSFYSGVLQRRSAIPSPADANRHTQIAAVRQILRGPRLQAKLTIGAPDDVYEQQADRVADEVMRMPEPVVQAAPTREEDTLQTRPLTEPITPFIQRQAEEEEEVPLQPKADGGRTTELTADATAKIAALHDGGQPLPTSERAFFEPRFGADFGQVRIHTGADPAASAQAVNARAFTLGHCIVFAGNQFTPETHEGKRLMAHELTHVLQQTGGNCRTGAPDNGLQKKTASASKGSPQAGGLKANHDSLSAAPLSVQRYIAAGTPEITTENLAKRVVDGRSTAGFVAMWLNGHRIDGPDLPTNEAAAIKAIQRPAVGSRLYNVDGPDGPELHGDGWIKAVSSNELRIQMQWLTPPPWTVVTTKDTVGRELFLGPCTGPNPCTLTVNGLPDSDTLAENTKTHEEQHAKDVTTAFTSVFKPWDDQITLAWKNGEVFSGPPAQVNDKLWTFLGGSPETIAARFVAEVDRLGKSLHKGLAEPKLYLKNNRAGPGCNTASVDAEGGK